MVTGGMEAPNRFALGLFSAVFFLAPLITSVFPKLAPLFMPLVAFAMILAALRRGLGWKALLAPSAALALGAIFALYVLLNASWAWNPIAGFEKASILLGAILLVFAAAAASNILDDRLAHRAAMAFVAGASLGTLFLLVEFMTDGAITRFAMNTIPAIRPDKAKRLVISDSVVTGLNMSKFDQNVTFVMLHLWPGLLMLRALASPRCAPMMALFFGMTATAILFSEQSSSQVALLGSAVVFILAWKWHHVTIRGLAVAWCLAFALVLPLNFLAYDAGLHLSESLPSSFKARIIIWEFTSERTLEHPWLGTGVNSTRERDAAGVDEIQPAEQPEGFVYKRTTAHHAHSIFLQSWYELGAVGAALMAMAGALVALRIGSLPREAQPFACSTFAASALIGAFAWGMWQTWFMTAIALAALYVGLGASAIKQLGQPPKLLPRQHSQGLANAHHRAS